MNAFVVTHWHASQTADKEGNFVHIAGRKAGLVDFLLTLLKLNSRVLLKVSDSGLIFAESSLFGERNVNTPLSKVTTTIYGWKRPFWEAVFVGLGAGWFLGGTILGVLMVVTREENSQSLAILAGGGTAVLISIGCGAIYYRLNRVLTLGIVTESGETYWVRLKRSLIENIKLDQPLAEAASKVIDSLVLARCAGTQPAGAMPQGAAALPRVAAGATGPAGSAPTPTNPGNPPAPASATAAHSAVAPGPSPTSPAGRPASPVNPGVVPSTSTEPRATCIYCATRVAFPPEGAGLEVPCPSCGKQLLLVAS